jgi:hypothetical protein
VLSRSGSVALTRADGTTNPPRFVRPIYNTPPFSFSLSSHVMLDLYSRPCVAAAAAADAIIIIALKKINKIDDDDDDDGATNPR